MQRWVGQGHSGASDIVGSLNYANSNTTIMHIHESNLLPEDVVVLETPFVIKSVLWPTTCLSHQMATTTVSASDAQPLAPVTEPSTMAFYRDNTSHVLLKAHH